MAPTGPAQHKSIGLTSGGKKTHQLWRNGTDKGRDPLRTPRPITLSAAALFARSTDGREKVAPLLCRLQCPSDLIRAPCLTWSLTQWRRPRILVDKEEINTAAAFSPIIVNILILKNLTCWEILSSSFDFTELRQLKMLHLHSFNLIFYFC